MAVGVETLSLLLPMILCGSLGHGAPRPPLRQATGRYVTLALVRCKFIGNSLREAYNNQKADYYTSSIGCKREVTAS